MCAGGRGRPGALCEPVQQPRHLPVPALHGRVVLPHDAQGPARFAAYVDTVLCFIIFDVCVRVASAHSSVPSTYQLT
jgi:hypothetical protein